MQNEINPKEIIENVILNYFVIYFLCGRKNGVINVNSGISGMFLKK